MTNALPTTESISRALLVAALFGASATPAFAGGFIRTVGPDLAITHISPNGRYMISEVRGYVEIFDLENGTKDDFYGDFDLGEDYSCGFGNAMSDNGVAVMSTSVEGNANYVKGGTVTPLPVIHPELTNLAHGITPDASRICGQVGNQPMSLDATEAMCVPCVWNLLPDGSYSEPVLLPYPDKDFSGRVPQYVTALCISDDGRTVAGQVRDFSGMMTQPIIYTQAEDGTWSYSFPFPELVNPDGIELPADPGEAPQDNPQPEQFMTDKERQEYAEAMQAWEDEGTWDFSKYPEAVNFLTPEQKAAYEAAVADYESRLMAWEEKYIPFQEALSQIMATSTAFMFNNLFMTPDGAACAATIVEEVEDPYSWSGYASNTTPVLMKLSAAGNEFERLDCADSMIASCIATDNTVLANTDGLSLPKQCFIALKGESGWQPIETWLEGVSPETAAWFKENASHDVEVFIDYELDYLENYLCSGVGTCTPDMTMFATYSEVLWEGDTSFIAESYIFSVDSGNGVMNIGGTDAELVETLWYSLDGRRLNGAPASGVAVRQTRMSDGTFRSEKIAR